MQARICGGPGWATTQVYPARGPGKSGATAEDRLGFQRLLAEVSLEHVGLILGLEMSRLARSCKDWHQLRVLCALFPTILADQDRLYDPTDHNGRLLLGLTGIMSEEEIRCRRKSGVSSSFSKEIRCQFIILARKD